MTHLCDKDVNEIWDISKPWSMLSDILSTTGETFEPRLLRECGKNTLLSVFVVGLYTPDKKLIGTGKKGELERSSELRISYLPLIGPVKFYVPGIGETVEIAQEMAARDALSLRFGTRSPRPTFKFLTERPSNSKHFSPEAIPRREARNN